MPARSGEFVRVILRPKVTLAPGRDRELAVSLHAEAHAMCFIASSVRFPVALEPSVVSR
jgi:organic hydroperoxide reductase OsmC/OhrA